MAKVGRPSLYQPSFVIQATKLAELGATDLEAADFFGITRDTFYKWKHAHPEFADALKIGKQAADDRVERSLYHKAIGYSFDAVKIVVVGKEVRKVPYREHVPPDTTAGIFWLKNRKPEQWRDVWRGEFGRPGDFDKLSQDELRASIAEDLATLGAEGEAPEMARIEGTAGPKGRTN